MPPTRENKSPEIDNASPPHNIGTMLPIVEPTNIPIQMNFLVIDAPILHEKYTVVAFCVGPEGR
jgi:hypothetical protein